jgi:dihydroorotase
MSHPILLQAATLVQNGSETPHQSVLIQDGVVQEVGSHFASLPEGTEVMDCQGKLLFPGLFDLQAHLNSPGREDRETLESGCRAALRGGITGLVMMPDTANSIDSGSKVKSLRAAAEKMPIELFVSGTISKGRRGEELAELGAMREAGAVFMTDAPDPVDNPLLMRRALDYAKNLGILIATSCDVGQLTSYGVMNEGRNAYRLGLPGIPDCSEEIALVRDLRLAQSVESTIHINQISTKGSVETVGRYKRNDMRFSVGVAPHLLIFTDDALVDEKNPYETNFKVKPPLRSEDDRMVLLEALAEGDIDVISTDHSPFTISEKEREFSGAPFGMTGLETSLVGMHHHLILRRQLDWTTLVRAFSDRPREIIGQRVVRIAKGQPINAVLFNPQAETCFDIKTRASKSSNCPFIGQTLTGRVERVLLGNQNIDPHAL